LRRYRVHRIPPHVRDDREAPLLPRRDGGKRAQFLIFRKRNIWAWRTDNPNQLESVHEIRILAHAIFRPERRSREATSSKIEVICPSGKSLVASDAQQGRRDGRAAACWRSRFGSAVSAGLKSRALLVSQLQAQVLLLARPSRN
jgi:hypothetical protein